MVIDAVRGRPAIAPSRTAHFYSGRRAQTPGPAAMGDSSGSDTEREATLGDRDVGSTETEMTGESSYYGETDSATEMDLITKSFKKVTQGQGAPEPQTPSQDISQDVEIDAPESM